MEEKGFLASLFDASFSSMITVKIVSFLYVTALIYLGVVGLAVLVYAFKEDVLMGLVGLILLPVAFVFFAILIRVYAELIIVIFKIADNTSVTAESVRQGAIVATFTSLNGDVLEIHRAATGQLIAKLAL